jgi:tetraacyldisaccharide 4'-kinase
MSAAAFVRARIWERRGALGTLLWLLLWPASLVFGVVARLRRWAFAAGLRRVTRAGIPVVSVGNLSVGGTGKTPFALWLAEGLLARGWRVAIVLRGYGGSAAGPTLVGRAGEALVPVQVAGDEAVMLSKRFAGVVIAARDRAAGVARAEAEGCDLAVLDDGFQHLQLGRDCDVVLLGPERGSLLPAGPFREPRAALRRAQAVIAVDKGEGESPKLPSRLAAPVFRARFRAVALVESDRGRWQTKAIGLLAGSRVATVCAIGNPEAFQREVRAWEAEVHEIVALDDHHLYTVEDWRRIANRTRQLDLVLTTEKDLVKLEQFPFERGKLLALRLAPDVERGEELIDLVCERIGRAPKGGEDGHQSGVA